MSTDYISFTIRTPKEVRTTRIPLLETQSILDTVAETFKATPGARVATITWCTSIGGTRAAWTVSARSLARI